MNKKILYSSMVFFLLFCMPALSLAQNENKEEQGKIIKLNTKEFREKVYDYRASSNWEYRGDKPALIDFYADWCGPCRRMKPTVEKIAKDYAGKIYVYAVNVDDNPELAQVFRVSAIPMTLVVPLKGRPYLNNGALSYQQFASQIEKVLAGEEAQNK